MSDEPRDDGALFREEALDYHARHRGPGDLMRIGSVWINRLYWLVLVLVVIGIAAAWTVDIDSRSLLEILAGKR